MSGSVLFLFLMLLLLMMMMMMAVMIPPFTFFFDIRIISLAFQPALETKRSPGILLNLHLGWDYLDIKPSGLINYQALSLSKVKTAIGAPSHMI